MVGTIPNGLSYKSPNNPPEFGWLLKMAWERVLLPPIVKIYNLLLWLDALFLVIQICGGVSV